MKGGAARMLAGDFTHGENAYDAVLARAVQHAANFDAAALKTLEPIRHYLADFFEDHQRVLDIDWALRDHPGSEFCVSHAQRLSGECGRAYSTPLVLSVS